MNSLLIEKYGPLFFAAASAAAWYIWGFDFSITYTKEILAGLITASAIGAGFMATALSILLSVGDKGSASKIAKSPYKKYFYRYIRSCFYSCLLMVALCLVAFLFIDSNDGLQKNITNVIVGFCGYSVAAFVRITEILLNIFES